MDFGWETWVGLVLVILGLVLLFTPQSYEENMWKKHGKTLPANLHRNAMIVGGVLVVLGLGLGLWPMMSDWKTGGNSPAYKYF